jgi:hypothetical protein
MFATRSYVTVAALFAAAIMLAGCQSEELKACKSEKAFQDQRIKEYKQVVEMKDKTIAEHVDTIKDMTAKLGERDSRIAVLEKDNEELRKKLSMTPEGSQRVIQGVEEIRRMQQQAAARLKAQQPADANKPK